MLDLFISNDHASKVFVADDVLLPLDQHHPALFSTVHVHSPMEDAEYDSLFFDFKRGDWVGLNHLLAGVDWDVVLRPIDDINVMLDRFYDILYSGVNQFIPTSRLKTPKFPRWYNDELKSLILEKKMAHKRYKASSRFGDYMAFSRLREQCKITSKRCYQEYVRVTEEAMPGNMKSFWNFVNDKRTDNRLPQSMFLGEVECGSSADIASSFAKHFKSIYKPGIARGAGTSFSNTITDIVDCAIDLQTVYNMLCSLKCNKGPGPDGIPPLLLYTCRCSLARPLLKLFTVSLKCGIFPNRWKKSFITPIYKKGSRSNILNYRPISILSTIPKLFENIITNEIKVRVTSGLTRHQHGFCGARSANTNLMCFTHFVTSALENHLQVDAIYTDFSKAFDTVDIGILCAKLSSFGIGGRLLRWLQSYLSGRVQSVRIVGAVSEDFAVTSGVPQGSHLGPLLFNIFINDVGTCLGCPFLLFADDCKIYRVVSSLTDCRLLQDDLDSFTVWCKSNGLDLNVDKCQVMSFCRAGAAVAFPYSIDGRVLQTVNKVKDLGVILDPKLSYHLHYDYMVNRAFRMLGFICRAGRDFSGIDTLRLLYQSLVRSLLEYCSPVWSPYYECHIHSIELVQNRFLRFVSRKLNIHHSNFSATAMRSVTRLPRLSVRRSNAELLFLYKTVNSQLDCPDLLAQIDFFVPPRNTRSHCTFSQSVHRSNYALHSPIARLHARGNMADVDFFNVSLGGLRRILWEDSLRQL